MAYFRDFPRVFYNFGDEAADTYIQNLAVYADVVDQVKDSISFYTKYYIKENERPDQLSFKLYDTPSYYWTFFLMNDHLRERGWPLSNREIIAKAQKDHPKLTITTRTPLFDKFRVGQTIEGTLSGATATIDHRHIDLGQLVLSNVSGTFIEGELVSSYIPAEVLTETITVHSTSLEYLSARYYTDTSGQIEDIDPTIGPNAFQVEVTYLDFYIQKNNELKEIKVIKPDVIIDVISAFSEAIKS